MPNVDPVKLTPGEQQDFEHMIEEVVPLIVKETKAGWKTTEFWITLVTILAVVFDGIPLPEKYEGMVSAALAGLYALARGLAKAGVPDVVEPAKKV